MKINYLLKSGLCQKTKKNLSENEDISSLDRKYPHDDESNYGENYSSFDKKSETLKIVLLGGNKVGKTSIIKRLANSFNNELDKTYGTDFSIRKIYSENENKYIILEI